MRISAGTIKARRLRGGAWGPLMVILFAGTVLAMLYGIYRYPIHHGRTYGHGVRFNQAMFGPRLEQPIAFSHRLHVTDKEIDCYYCHPYGERSLNAGLPSVDKCLGCHEYIIPEHEEILKLKQYREEDELIPWQRVYYNPDHVYFPHFRHLKKNVACTECHGELERADRLHQVTFYMGFCIDCHQEKNASLECTACHQ
ncbi:MAG: cytochrome c3 family protein [Myxococcota bacterium]|nr:cytochrome c3 family protein [Myxococcota bacterium]